jgi:asparagine synthase (glutamine-hydrolysing)
MCGIDGFLNSVAFDEETARGTLARMTASLAHRGPDGQGMWVDPEAGIALGHRRLAIVDLSVQGRQPMASACGRYVLVFNGEIYNHRELRAELERTGRAPRRGRSDSEVLVAAIAAWGVDATLRRATGMFAFALEPRVAVLTLARDRIGEKPLYYGRIGDALVFASELKALRGYPGFDGAVDRDALCLYLRQSSVPAPHTIYRGISKLPPGTFIQFEHARDTPRVRTGRSSRRSKPAASGRSTATPTTPSASSTPCCARPSRARWRPTCRSAHSCRAASIRRRSSRWMQAQSAKPVDTFTIGFHEAGYDEAGYEGGRAPPRHAPHRALRDGRPCARRRAEAAVDLRRAVLRCLADPDLSRVGADAPARQGEPVRRRRRRAVRRLYALLPHAAPVAQAASRAGRGARARIAAALHALRPDHADQLAAVAQGAWGGVDARDGASRIGDRLHKLGHVMTAESRIGLYRLLMSSVHHPERLALAGQSRRRSTRCPRGPRI